MRQMTQGELDVILKLINGEDTVNMITKKKIEDVVKSMPMDKAPGPDGLPAQFSKELG